MLAILIGPLQYAARNSLDILHARIYRLGFPSPPQAFSQPVEALTELAHSGQYLEVRSLARIEFEQGSRHVQPPSEEKLRASPVKKTAPRMVVVVEFIVIPRRISDVILTVVVGDDGGGVFLAAKNSLVWII